MSYVAAAIAGGAVIGGVVNYMNGQNAIAAQEDAANRANATQMQMYEQNQADQQPYRQAGYAALNQIQKQLPDLNRQFNATDFHQDPGYQFRMQQGLKAIQGSAAARGSLNSGATLKALGRYGQQFASNEYNNAYNRFTQNQNNRFNHLASLAGIGQTATNQTGAYGQNTANQISSNQIGLGNSEAANYINQGNQFSNLLSQGAMAYGMYRNPSMATLQTKKLGTYGGTPQTLDAIS